MLSLFFRQVFKHRLDRESKMRAEKEAERAKTASEEALPTDP